MAQHDYNIANATGANFRADLNASLQAVVTQNAGSTQPAVTFPGMLWLDLSGGGDGVMRRRNQANSAWLTDIGVDQTARDAAAAAQATANSAVQRGGTDAQRTMSAPLILPNAVPTGHQAVSRTQADALYQVKLPTAVAGALLMGNAAGWTDVIAPAAAGTILTMSGGLPSWLPTVTTASPNGVVRTLSDGTIDPSFIPQVASGLKFCGTFKPVVNDEYPAAGDGGHGAGGAPAIGDFWVIDGLTTGGYTYLTGSLAGVTVYNGDSIAFNGAGTWYKMGSSVSLQGYMKLDGSTAMAGDLNLGTHNLIEVGGITARAGQPVPLTNFKIDASNVVISPQRGATGADLAAMQAGQLGTDLGRMQLYVGAGGSNTPMLPVRYFSPTSAYTQGEHVFEPASQALWRARGAIAAGAFVHAQWSKVVDEYNGYFQANVSIVTSSYPAVILSNTGNAVDKTRGGYSIENTTGDMTLGLTNDANTVSHGGIRIARGQGGALCPIVNAGGSLGYNLNRWSALYLGGNVDVSANVFTLQMSSPGGQNRYRLLTNTSDSVDGGLVIARWNGTAYEDKFVAKSEGVFAVHALPLQASSNLGGTTMRWFALYLKNAIDFTGDVSSIVMSSAGLANRYRFLTNISDSVDGGMGIQRWDGAAFQDQFVVRNLNALTRTLYPMFDNQYQCGGAGNRWTAVYAVNGTIQTSDARDKITVPLADADLAAGRAILDLLLSYRWRPEHGADDGKKHYGATAQSVLDAFVQAGFLADQVGAVQYESWPAVPPELGPDGEVMIPGREAGDHYGLNYAEVHSLCLADLHRRLLALEAAP